jgi:hypothetical protein
MDFTSLAALEPQRCAAKDCVLFLWATDPLLPKALELIEAWGFTYKTVGFYWAKTNKRARLEQLSPDDFFTGLGLRSHAHLGWFDVVGLDAAQGLPPVKLSRRSDLARKRERRDTTSPAVRDP